MSLGFEQVVVDASVWISSFVESEPSHAVSREWLFERLSGGHLIAAPSLLLPEVCGAIARRTGDRVQAQAIGSRLRSLPNVKLIDLSTELASAAAQAAIDLGLRGADAVYVAVAASLRAPLVTWDIEQRERSRSRIDVRTP